MRNAAGFHPSLKFPRRVAPRFRDQAVLRWRFDQRSMSRRHRDVAVRRWFTKTDAHTRFAPTKKPRRGTGEVFDVPLSLYD